VGDEIGRLNRLLTEFLELARPRAPVRELVQFRRLIDDVLDLEQGAALARGVAVERDLVSDGALPRRPEKLKQVVLNLVDERARSDEGRRQARGPPRRPRPRVRLVVEDTGTGIDAAALAQVFDPFFTTKEGGTGLGLSIVRKIVDQHAGEVRIESLRGAGTRSQWFSPAAEPPKFSAPEVAGAEPWSRLAGEECAPGSPARPTSRSL